MIKQHDGVTRVHKESLRILQQEELVIVIRDAVRGEK